ncbi:MAG: hypothetical protein OEQ28_12355, partial [Acidobacteriota bacterium]|nr:hypothetical protein [Acidobacteriota bacterium]
EKATHEKILIPAYDFFIYGNIADERSRNFAAFVIGFAFLIYTETVFALASGDPNISVVYLIASVFLSYFPMRMLLVITPPFSLTELGLALAAFGVFLFTLVF